MTSLTTAQLHRAARTLIGAAVGDALGAGYEFRLDPPPDAQMIGGGPFGFAPGEWTDDTQMAICIAEEAATGTLDPSVVGDRFLQWCRGGQRDVGMQTASVLRQAKNGSDCSRTAAEYYRQNPSNSAGNGSLMRTAPVALAHLGDSAALMASARAISGLTHADPQAEDACALWCTAIDHAVLYGSLGGGPGAATLLEGPAAGRWAGIVADAECQPGRIFTHNGYVVKAYQAAHAAVHQTPVSGAPPSLRGGWGASRTYSGTIPLLPTRAAVRRRAARSRLASPSPRRLGGRGSGRSPTFGQGRWWRGPGGRPSRRPAPSRRSPAGWVCAAWTGGTVHRVGLGS